MTTTDILWRQQISSWIALITLIYASFQYGFIFYRQQERQYNLNIHFVFFGSLTLIVLDVIDDQIYNITGMNNLFWYLGYGLAALTTYLMGVSICRYGYTKTERWVHLGFFTVIIVLSLLYYTHLKNNSNWPMRLPRDWGEFIFSQALFIYATFIGVISVTGRIGFLKAERNPVVRARMFVSIMATTMALVCFLGKVVYLGLAFFYAEISWINRLAVLALAAIVPFWLISILPKQFYIFILEYNPVSYVYRMYQLFLLRRLLIKTDRICPLPQPLQLDNRRCILGDLNIATYRTTIAILDRYEILKGFIERPDSSSLLKPNWTDKELRIAQRLYKAFTPLEENRNSDYKQLTKQLLLIYRDIQSIEMPSQPVSLRLFR